MSPDSVILIVDRDTGYRFCDFGLGVPIWMVNSPANFPTIRGRFSSSENRDHRSGLTSFDDCSYLTPSELAAGEIATVVEHHPSLRRFTIFGAHQSTKLDSALAGFGFAFESQSEPVLTYVRAMPNQSTDLTL
jgi:hypothetical protein